ncbi:MAG: SAM-dependent methyltransferase [Labedaea sp.]
MTALPEPFSPKRSPGPQINTEQPNLGRMYDYYLGGSFNYSIDRARAEQVCGVLPCMTMLARSNRGFVRRTVRFMIDEGIEQFLDIGSGIPTNENTHEVALAGNPAARVVYVDNEPIAVTHGQRILADTVGARIVQADLREPQTILNHPEVTDLIDFRKPVGVLMGGVLVFVPDYEDPAGLVAAYRDGCAPGSYIAISHLTHDEADPVTRGQVDTMVGIYRGGGEHLYVRERVELTRWFDGLELVPPGVTLMDDWRPDPNRAVDSDSPARWLGYGGVGQVV